jgi:methionyl-tRNA synthetase
VRYFLLREVPFGNDGDFAHRAMVNRMNGELANDLGNLVQRVLTMIARNCDGGIPEGSGATAADTALLDAARGCLATMRRAMADQALHEALEALWVVVRAANGYIAAQEPWVLRKTDPARMATVLYTAAEAIRCIALLLQPFTPQAAARILDQLAVPEDARDFARIDAAHALAPGTPLPPPQAVFPRYVETDAAQ